LPYTVASHAPPERTAFLTGRHFTNNANDTNRTGLVMTLLEILYRLSTVIWGN